MSALDNLQSLPEDEGLGQALGALTGDIRGYCIGSRCLTFFLRDPGAWPWRKPICVTDFAQLVFSREKIIKQAETLLKYLHDAVGSGHEGFDPSAYEWQVRAVGCSTLREPPWYLLNDFTPITIYRQRGNRCAT